MFDGVEPTRHRGAEPFIAILEDHCGTDTSMAEIVGPFLGLFMLVRLHRARKVSFVQPAEYISIQACAAQCLTGSV